MQCQGVGCTPWRPSGVPLVSLGLRCFCVAGVGQCAPPGGRMYALASLWCPLGSAAFAWQAWDNRFCVAGVGQCALPRGRMHALLILILFPSSYSSSRPPTHSHTSLTHHSHTSLTLIQHNLSIHNLHLLFHTQLTPHQSFTISFLFPAFPMPSLPFFCCLLEEVDMWGYPVL